MARDYPSAIIVHSLAHGFAAAGVAAELCRPLVLRSVEGAGGTVGIGWFVALAETLAQRFPALDLTLVLDCADEAGTAMGALRCGIKRIRFSGPADVARRLAMIADACGAALDDDTGPVLDLLAIGDPVAACRNWLAEGAFIAQAKGAQT